ncbi:FecR family protein [Steroidobacter agaridevorans]|uniref:FecR family protein n=1 Tax=Steroidobacter agaridevorans TaxID=2695856 RepID=UPI0013226961|nr:FecR domain-containing protein [Steroidobacter agaridevorans]GFE85515.1 peptide ABC transporter substrate-binding protein [Steroidobacter agaridevorans]
MGEVHRLPDPEVTEREASDWFARMNADDVTADDRARFDAWLAAHPCNVKAYAELEATWKELVRTGPLVRAVYFGQVMNAASARSARAPRWLAGALAATVAAIVLSVSWSFYKQQADTRFQTAIGEQVAVMLPDGSSLNLNTNSQVDVEYSQRSRVIHLERGEAYFNVAHDAHRPFWVHAGNRWVRAVGTAFNVYVRPAGVQVTVSEGTVNVVDATGGKSPPSDAAYAKSAAAVTAGEQADAQGNADVIRALNAAELNRSLAWRNKSLYFHDEPLGNVVNELMRYTRLQIEVVDDSLRQLPVGGTFQTSPEGAEALLKMLEDGFGAQVRRHGADHVYIEAPAE